MTRIFCLLILVMLSLPEIVLGKDCFSDPRLNRWAAMTLEGKNAEVVQEVEQDLISGDPFIFSPYIWKQLLGEGKYVRERYKQITNPRLRKALSQWQEVTSLDYEERHLDLLKRYPPAALKKQHNPLYALNLQWAAEDQNRYEAALRYAQQELASGADIFWFPWSTFHVFEQDERVRARFVKQLKQGNASPDKEAARFLLTMLEARPLTNEVMISCANDWLKTHPRDPHALLFLAMHLNDAGKYKEAAPVFEEIVHIFPFMSGKWEDYAVILRKLQRNDEADRVIVRSVQLGGFKDREQMTGLRRYKVLAQFNEDEAYILLDDLNRKWPDHEELTAARADLEIKLKRYADALEFARAVAKQHPKKIEHQVRLLKALYESHREKEARSLYHSIRKNFPEITTGLYEVAEEMLANKNDAPKLERLRTEYARQFPDSRRLPELKGDKLGASGRLDKAIREYRKLFAINAPDKNLLRKYADLQRKKSGLKAAVSALDEQVLKYPWVFAPNFLTASPAQEYPITGKRLENKSDSLPRLVAQIGHKGAVNALALSPDKTLLASAGSDGMVILWQLESGKELRRFPHQQPVRAVCFSNDGSTLVTGSDDGVVRTWDSASGTLQHERKILEGGVRSLAVSPSGETLLAGGASKTALLLAISDFKELARLEGHTAGINASAFAPDGRHAATASIDGTIRLWEVPTGKQLFGLYGHIDAVTSLAFTADGKFLVSGSVDETAKLWHLASGVELASIETLGRGVQSLAIQPDAPSVVLAGLDDGKIASIDFGKDEIKNRFSNQAPETRDLKFLENKRLLAAGGDGVIREFNLTDNGKVRTFTGLADTRPPAGFSPDGNFVVSTTGKGFVRLWSLAGNEGHFTIRPAQENGPVSWSFSGDGRLIAVFSRSGAVVIHDLHDLKEKRRFTLKTPGVLQLLLSKDGSSLATLHEDGTARLWDPETVEQKAKISRVLALGTPIAFTPDGSRLLVGSEDSMVHILESYTGTELNHLEVHTRGIVSVAVSSDGKTGAFSSLDSTVSIWDLAGFTQKRKLDKLQGAAVALSFKPDTHDLVMATPGAPVSVVNTDAKELMPSSLGASSVETDGLALSGNGDYALTGSSLYGERLWDLARGKEIANFKVGVQPFSREVFSPNGSFVAVPDDRGVIRLIDVVTGKERLSLISFSDDTWAVVAPDGRFDTNNLEEIKGLNWIMPDAPFTPLPVEAFMREYYEPRLLTKLLAGKTNLPKIKSPASLNRIQPTVSVDKVEPAADKRKVLVTVTARQVKRGSLESGLTDLRLFRNGQLVGYVNGPLPLDKDGRFVKTFTVSLPMAEDEGTVATFTAYAFNSDRIKSVTSQPVAIPLPQGKPQRHAYIVSIGVGAYANQEADLHYPPIDAAAFNHDLIMSLIATGRFAMEDVIPVLLTNNGTWNDKANNKAGGVWQNITNNLAHREIIQGVLDLLAGRQEKVPADLRTRIPNAEKLNRATPDDLVVITFSGHGITTTDGFLFSTADKVESEKTIANSFIPSSTLANWLRDIDAGELDLIIDACHSGAAVGDKEFKPGPMGSRGLGQLAYDKGIRVLAGTQADNRAWEYDQLGHGLLTYALLHDGLGVVADAPAQQTHTSFISMKQWLTIGVVSAPKIQMALNRNTYQVAKNAKSSGQTIPPSEDKPQQPALFDFRRQHERLSLATWK